MKKNNKRTIQNNLFQIFNSVKTTFVRKIQFSYAPLLSLFSMFFKTSITSRKNNSLSIENNFSFACALLVNRFQMTLANIIFKKREMQTKATIRRQKSAVHIELENNRGKKKKIFFRANVVLFNVDYF
jgi:hypothetical protein